MIILRDYPNRLSPNAYGLLNLIKIERDLFHAEDDEKTRENFIIPEPINIRTLKAVSFEHAKFINHYSTTS